MIVVVFEVPDTNRPVRVVPDKKVPELVVPNQTVPVIVVPDTMKHVGKSGINILRPGQDKMTDI